MESCIENSVRIVKGEIHNVLSLMRLNRRYNHGARFHREVPAAAESPLVRGLKALHEELGPYTNLQDMDTMAWLRPFLDVIESAETSGPITGGALSSLSKFLNYGFIHKGSPRAAESVCRICRIVTRCRFERTDHSGDEVVLVRILQVLLDCLRSPAGTLLSDQNVWDMVQSCFDIGKQQRLSELLQKTAEHMLMQVVLTVFARFSQLQASGELSQDVVGSRPLRSSLGSENDANGSANDQEADGSLGDDEESLGLAADVAPPYGMPCMFKILEFLCQLTHAGDSSDPVGSEQTRMLGLSLVNVVLETGGRQLSACPALVGVIQHDLSRNLLQNSRTNNLQILSLTLRVVFNMFNSVREHMKVQLEVFFNSIHLAESSSYETREMALESLVEFCKEPQLMVDIYTNYDCDVQCTNLFEDMCKYLSKNTFPLSGSLNALNQLSLEGLLAIVRSLAEACDGGNMHEQEEDEKTDEGSDQELAVPSTAEKLRHQKQHKKRLAMAAEQFNRNPKKSFEFLQSTGFLPDTLDAESLCHFLLNTPGLDRTAIGSYLGEPDELALDVLERYVYSFDFTDLALADALRRFLSSFRLPGESQKIARIVERFAGHYFSQSPGPLANADTAYILSYAIIMLNTDLHNHQVKKKMTKEDFVKMNRGINDNQDLPFAFLSDIYDSIATSEIKMSEDLADVNADSNAEPRWDDLLATMGQKYRNAFVAAPAMGSIHGRDMFLVAWDRIISAFSVVFETTEDDKVLRKTIEGFHDFAKICSSHGLHDEFNKLIATLIKSLYKFAESSDALKPLEEEANWIFVRNHKVQLAAQAMFTISFSHADCLRDGWRALLDYVARLHRIKALPASLLERDDFVDLQGRPLLSSTDVAINLLHREAGGGGRAGVRSIFSYLWGSGPAAVEQKKNTFTTCLNMPGYEELTAWVASLKLEELLMNTKFLSNDALASLNSALIVSSSRLISLDGGSEAHDPSGSLETSILFLELLTNTALANQQRISLIWQPLHVHFQQLLQSIQYPSLSSERIVVNQLRLCLRLAPVDAINADLMEGVRCIPSLPASVLKSLADRISVGLLTLLRANANNIKQREDWRSILSLLQEFASMAPSASRPALESMSFLLREEGRQHISALNFDFCQQALLGFIDSLLDPNVARQHAALALNKPTCSGAEVRKWQQAAGMNIMELMYCLFLRLRTWKAAGDDKRTVVLTYQPLGPHQMSCGAQAPAGETPAAPAAPAPEGAQGHVEHEKEATRSIASLAAEQTTSSSVAIGVEQTWEDGPDSNFGLGYSPEDEQSWCNLWMLCVKSFCRLAHDDKFSLLSLPALESLERALLSADVYVPYATAWRDCYDQIVFPIVSSKFKTAANAGQTQAEIMCLNTLLVLCKSYRNNLHLIIHLPELHMLWLRLLGLIEAFKLRIRATKRDPISNEIVQVLKEMLQAMHSDPQYQKVQQSSGQDMWALTATVIDAFCPDLKGEIMPVNVKRPTTAPPPPQEAPHEKPNEEEKQS